MRHVEEALARDAEHASAPFIRTMGSSARVWTYGDVRRAVEVLAERISVYRIGRSDSLRVGLICANTPEFIVADLALLSVAAVEIPVPLSFSSSQAHNLLKGIDLYLVDERGAARLEAWRRDWEDPAEIPAMHLDAAGFLRERAAGPLSWVSDDRVCKIIHTSGTTSQPKGVCIRNRGLEALLDSLCEVMPKGAFARSVSLVPFSLLVEQVTSIYMVMAHRGCLTLPPVGVSLVGTAPDAADGLLSPIRHARPTALVATPVLVERLAAQARAAARRGEAPVRALFDRRDPPLLCCGGAPLRREVLSEMTSLGVPVYEGYGLSENGSVVCWNRPGTYRAGTVGRALPHVQLRLAEDGELCVKSTSLFSGYSNEDPSSCRVDEEGWLHTGDLACIDADGFVTITGRKKALIITAAGRNVSPQWVEARYRALPVVREVAVWGDGASSLCGLFLIPRDVDESQARYVIDTFGERELSDVERPGRVHIMRADDATHARFFTTDGRPRRDAIARAFPIEHDANREKSGRIASPTLAERGMRVGDLQARMIVPLLARQGYVLLRGFDPTLDDFSSLVRRLSERITLDPARGMETQHVAQRVDAGTAPVGLHLENGNSPFASDLTWFYCERAARKGSETTLCDGYRVWERSSTRARDRFASMDIVYRRRVDADKWRTFVYHRMDGWRPMKDIVIDDLRRLVRDPGSTTIETHDDGAITYTFKVPAAHVTLFDDRLAWANSIFGPSYNYEAPTITFEDGTPIEEGTLHEMRRVTEDLTLDIPWCDGDIAIIDNTRVMHGRRAILDENRKIYNAQSYIRPELVMMQRSDQLTG